MRSPCERERSRIDQELRGIAALACGGVVRTVHPVPVRETHASELRRQEAVPDVTGARRQREARTLAPVVLEET